MPADDLEIPPFEMTHLSKTLNESLWLQRIHPIQKRHPQALLVDCIYAGQHFLPYATNRASTILNIVAMN
jgi:hypothetical protein